MDIKEDFSQLLKIQLLSQLHVQVDLNCDGVTVTLAENLSFPFIFHIIKESAILCYDRLIYRRRLAEMHVPLSVIIKNESNSVTINFPEHSKIIKTS